jgi:hypothetical protein
MYIGSSKKNVQHGPIINFINDVKFLISSSCILQSRTSKNLKFMSNIDSQFVKIRIFFKNIIIIRKYTCF